MTRYLLYLHIPFCDSKCHYCAFNSYVDRFDRREAYMEALHRQLEGDLARFGLKEGQIATLFIGGGTPSTVAPELYAPLFRTLAPYLAPDAEITTEANPNSASARWLAGMRDLGVNRVSFGVQSFFDDKLALLGRAHRRERAIKALQEAAACGFAHLSVDLIYGTRLDTPRRIEQELEAALALPIDHLSAYELTIEEGTPFAATPDVRRESEAQARLLARRLRDAGWRHYEVSNFGRAPCRHNLGYWEYRPYLGAGAGAVGRVGAQRYYPTPDIDAYIQDPHARRIEPLTPDEMREERIFLGTRSEVGIDASLLTPPMRHRCEILAEEGRLLRTPKGYANPDFLLSDEIALFIIG